MTKDHGRHIHLFLFVFYYRDTFTIIPDFDSVVLSKRGKLIMDLKIPKIFKLSM